MLHRSFSFGPPLIWIVAASATWFGIASAVPDDIVQPARLKIQGPATTEDVETSFIGGPTASARSRLQARSGSIIRPRSGSIPERCVAHPNYVRVEEALKNSVITDPWFTHGYVPFAKKQELASPDGVKLEAGEQAALTAEVETFWRGFRHASDPREGRGWTINARDLCSKAFEAGFGTWRPPPDPTWSIGAIYSYHSGFMKLSRTAGPGGPRDRAWLDAFNAGARARTQFSGTAREAAVYAQCFRLGQVEAKEILLPEPGDVLAPEHREGIPRGHRNGIRVGYCYKKLREEWNPNTSEKPARQQMNDWFVQCLDLARQVYGGASTECAPAKQAAVDNKKNQPSSSSSSSSDEDPNRLMSVLGEVGRSIEQKFFGDTKPASSSSSSSSSSSTSGSKPLAAPPLLRMRGGRILP